MARRVGFRYNPAEEALRASISYHEGNVPLYEYQCLPEGHRFEARHGFNDEAVQTCPECGGPVRRIIHPVGVVFKGTGFYVTDSRKSDSGTKTPSTKSKNAESGGDSKSESKSEQKTESASS